VIRLANKYDIEDIIRLLKEFAIQSDNVLTNDPTKWSKTYIEAILATILAGKGFCLIDEEKTGILIAVKTPTFWIDNIYQLQEVMLYSNSKMLMLRLIKEYIRIAKDMIERNEITQAMICTYKDDRFERLGLKKTEIHWSID
jgi:hypothetical protein